MTFVGDVDELLEHRHGAGRSVFEVMLRVRSDGERAGFVRSGMVGWAGISDGMLMTTLKNVFRFC